MSVPLDIARVRKGVALLSGKGFRVLRVRINDKIPVDPGWPERATDDPNILDSWFPQIDAAYNVGVACGPQPNGLNLVVIDVDARHGGLDRWASMLDINGHPDTAMHSTPTGGLHIFFDAPLPINNTGNLGAGIDVRGIGGQVVVPPSTRIVDGTMVAYEPVGPRGLWCYDVAPLPDWLLTLLRPIERSIAVHPSQPRPQSSGVVGNADWLRDHWDWIEVLEGQGYDVVRTSGDRVFLRHPTATSEWSCTVDPADGRMNAYSTNMPSALRDAQINRDGSVSWSPYDWFVATQHEGNYSAATSEINRRREPLGGGSRRERAAGTAAPDQEGTDVPLLFMPPEWYQQRTWMAACYQMAAAVGGSPSAHLLAFMARWATLIPPGYSIPPINGAPSSFDLLGVIAGTSGSGKTSPMRNAAELLPVERKDLRLGLGIGSGEGIIEAFYGFVEVERDDGKKGPKERRKTIAGVNFSVSEGLIFAELAGRGGTTHVTRLCDAWSGAALSTANASAETFRHIDVNQYRLTLVMGIQADMAHELMNDSSASQGFVGRLLFAWAEEPRISPRPRTPERPDLPVPPRIGTADVYAQTYLDYPQAVYDEIQAASDARVGTNVPVEDHHHDLLRCKVAGILALMEGRTTVTVNDWALATDIVSVSANVRTHLYAHRLQRRRDERHNQAAARAEVEIVVDDIKERKGVASMAETIRRHVSEESMAVGALRKKTKGPLRHRFEAALELAISNGWIKVTDGRVEKV